MIRKVFEIMIKDYTTVDAFWGIRRVQKIVEKDHYDCFPVIENGEIVGILTRNDLITAHPNRIVLDAMSGRCKYIDENESVWSAKELFEDESSQILIVTHGDEVTGVITKSAVDIEIGKHVDMLTGLYKSSYIIHKSQKLLDQGGEISIIFFDVNNFGYINKKYGHTVGDNILKEISKILKECVPADTFLCRYGGDEFALLTGKCAEDCEVLAQSVLNRVRQHNFIGDISVGISAGIAGGKKRCNSRDGDMYKNITNLINLASLASTKAKKEKENLVLGFSGTIDEMAI
ncbi:GGDEF domain-containing protein [Ruminiclostridium cellobioparum]|jgi:diguanylate cyclase (GGDEF)-like protein|uniref:GGDEF domain-containing protein n=1 Tax=Ruminiclostridium cellobioparum TaxID=29355 RepID=UPI0028AE48DD|nr:GGDEF domain-containing protein [Ruminiclostridium cellobioparum]